MLCLLVLLAAALAAAMAGAWCVARHDGRSGWTDAIWSLSVGAACVAAALAPVGGAAPSARQWLVALLVGCWSLRLGLHIARRSVRGGDDPRYRELKREWGDRFEWRLFVFLQVQAAAAWVLMLSVLVAARNPAPWPGWNDAAGAAILIAAVIGEGVADAQLSAFRADPSHRGRVCDAGLWGLSRHPNYFFEWLAWIAWPVIAIGPAGAWGWGWLALSGPAFIYLLLVHVSGIPPLEAHMLRSRGDAFRDVQRRIRAFWPVPRRVPIRKEPA